MRWMDAFHDILHQGSRGIWTSLLTDWGPGFSWGVGLNCMHFPLYWFILACCHSIFRQRMLKDAIHEKKTSWQSCLQSRAADPWTDVFDPRGCFWRCIRHTEMQLKTRKQRSFIPLMVCHFNEQHIINRRIDALWCRIPSHHSLHIYIYIFPLMREHPCVYLMEWPMLPMSPHQRLVGSYGPEGWVVPNNFTEKNDVREITTLWMYQKP